MSECVLLLGYDTEDYGRKGKTPEEKQKRKDICVESVKKLVQLHKETGTVGTFFVLGRLIDEEPRIIGALKDSGMDIQQHTYEHTKIYEDNLPPKRDIKSDLKGELVKTRELIKEKLNIENIGVRVPYCFLEGVQNKPELQKAFKEAGMQFISTQIACQRSNQPQIKEHHSQPYELNGLLEFPINGLSDVSFYNEDGSPSMYQDKIVDFYLEELKFCQENNLVYTPGFHPWCIIRIDPNLDIIRNLINYAIENNIKVMSYQEYYNQTRGG